MGKKHAQDAAAEKVARRDAVMTDFLKKTAVPTADLKIINGKRRADCSPVELAIHDVTMSIREKLLDAHRAPAIEREMAETAEGFIAAIKADEDRLRSIITDYCNSLRSQSHTISKVHLQAHSERVERDIAQLLNTPTMRNLADRKDI